MSGFLLAIGAGCAGAVLVVAGICLGLEIINNNYKAEIDKVQNQLSDPALVADLATVDTRKSMLQGFEQYNSTVNQTVLLFNYQPKVQSYVIEKLREPIDDKENGILTGKEELEITNISINGYDVNVSFVGMCEGNPAHIPSAYAEYLTEKVKDKYGDAYFNSVSYTGFEKLNSSDLATYAMLSDEDTAKFDTLFSFDISMKLNMGSDEKNATIDLEPDETAEDQTAGGNE